MLGNATSEDPDRTTLTIGRNLLQAAVLQARGMVLTPHDPEPDEPYFTVLDPSRPARCLLDGLVGAIQALAGFCTPLTWTAASGPRRRANVSTRRCGRRQRYGLRSGCRSWWGPARDGQRLGFESRPGAGRASSYCLCSPRRLTASSTVATPRSRLRAIATVRSMRGWLPGLSSPLRM
jgi:hypothetical protein